MSRWWTLSWMAIHEMWISFRLIAVIGLPLLGGLLAIVVPSDLAGVTAVGGAGFWYAIGAGLAIAGVAGLAAHTMAHERRRGTIAWMAVRAVPRSALFLSWFIAFGLLLGLGIVLGSLGAWLAALSHAETTPDAVPYGAAVGASVGAGLAAVALGLLLGVFLPGRPATVVAFAVGAFAVAASIAVGPGVLASPVGGIGLMAHLDGARRPLGDALASGGVALATTSVLLILGVVGLERSDL